MHIVPFSLLRHIKKTVLTFFRLRNATVSFDRSAVKLVYPCFQDGAVCSGATTLSAKSVTRPPAAELPVVMNQRNISRFCRILGSCSGGYEEFYIVGYNGL
jgi:hypothetical protein